VKMTRSSFDRCPKKGSSLRCWEVRQENAGWNLDSGLEVERDPCWGMVARVFLPTCPSVNTAVHEAV
jgi:hypothetical protein